MTEPMSPQLPATVLPTVDELADAILASATTGEGWHVSGARAALDLIAASVPPWKPVAPGTVIKAGTLYRVEFADDGANERVDAFDREIPNSGARYYIDPRTIPAEPSGVERVCRILSFAHGVTATPEQIRATLDELGLELTENARDDQ